MRTLLTVLVVVWSLGTRVASAQSYTPSERVTIANNARRLLTDKYFANVEILTNYEANQPFEALQNQLNGLIRDAFRNRDVLVFNEFKNPANAYTTVTEYVKDCRIFSGGKAITNELNLADAHYDLQQIRTGEPFINVYLDKQLQGVDGRGKPFHYRNLTEFRVQFGYNKALNAYLNFKIAGINKVDKWPPTAFTFTEKDLAVAELGDSKDLLSVVTPLAQRLTAGLPTGPKRLTLEPFTYNRSGISDALSDRLFATFSSCLQRQDSLTVTSAAQTGNSPLVVRGYYNEAVNTLHITAELVDGVTGNILTTVDSEDLPLAWLSEHKLPLKPDTYQQVVAVQDTLQRTTAPGPLTALHVELRTDRGRSRVEYWENQPMRIEAVATRPCHLRLLYRLADGTQTILETDFTIKPGQENRPVPIAPDAAFVCSAPFGTEYLLAYASETPFCPLPTVPSRQGYVRNEGDYKIFVGPLSAMITTLKCTGDPAAVVVEDRIQITTRSARK
ncbi:MAG: hypothetical protein H7Z72_25540 [Bacteroidetes bacterium]|nr:hypothetical protein [Fibrella sp.]